MHAEPEDAARVSVIDLLEGRVIPYAHAGNEILIGFTEDRPQACDLTSINDSESCPHTHSLSHIALGIQSTFAKWPRGSSLVPRRRRESSGV